MHCPGKKEVAYVYADSSAVEQWQPRIVLEGERALQGVNLALVSPGAHTNIHTLRVQ